MVPLLSLFPVTTVDPKSPEHWAQNLQAETVRQIGQTRVQFAEWKWKASVQGTTEKIGRSGQAAFETWHAREIMNVLETTHKERYNVSFLKPEPRAREKIRV